MLTRALRRGRPARRRDGTLQCAPFGSPFVGSRMRPTSLPAALCYSLAVVALLSGCSSTSYTCSGNGEYQKAQDKPRLAMPAGVSGGEKVAGTLVIPPPPQGTTSRAGGRATARSIW